MKNNRGFVYPVVLVICTFLLFGLLVQTNVYLQEKRFSQEQHYILKVDTLIQRGLIDFMNNVSQSEGTNFFFSYDDGTVTLVVVSKSEAEWRFEMLAALTETNHKRQVHIYYDPYHHRIIEYWEVSKRDE